jgi:hypothetical protein
VGFLGVEVGIEGPDRSGLRVNQAISLEGLPPGAKVGVKLPGGPPGEMAADPAGTVRYPGTARAGVYELSAPGRPTARFAVNLLDEAESSIEPAAALRLSGQSVAAKEGVSRGNVEIWPLLVLLALALVLCQPSIDG